MRTIKVLGILILLAAACVFGACKSPSGASSPGQDSASGSAPQAASGPPSLCLITIDTWRWDSIGASGAGKVATPYLDRLAGEGVYEPEAGTPYPLTTPAHATLLTGLLPMRHGILDNVGYALPAGVPTLAEAFAAKGYQTAAFLSSASLDRRYGLNRGFAVYDQGSIGAGGGAGVEVNTREGSLTTQAVFAYLRAQGGSSPQFLWAHYFDLHVPYRPRPVYDARYPKDPYAAQAAFVDDQVGALTAFLESDRARRWRVLVVGDHGEGLGDHGEVSHGLGLYRSTMSVPLILWPKPDRPLPHGKPWRLEDLDPTIREWFGLPGGTGQDGESLFAANPVERLLPIMTVLPSIRYGVNPSLGIRKGRLTYIRQGVEELYDVAADPDEKTNLSGEAKLRSELEVLRAACEKTFPLDRLQQAAKPDFQASGSELDALRGLGYIGGLVPTFTNLQRADVRTVILDDERLKKAQMAAGASRDPKALVQAYRAILSRYPRAALYHQEFGILLFRLGDQKAAIPEFEAALKLDPRDNRSAVNLGTLYLMEGNAARAKVLLEWALALNEQDPLAHKNLGVLFAQHLNEPAKAVAHYKRYLQLAPDAGDKKAIGEYIRQIEGAAPSK